MISVDGSKSTEKAIVLSLITAYSKNLKNILSILTQTEATLLGPTNWKTLSSFSACVTPKSKWMNFSEAIFGFKVVLDADGSGQMEFKFLHVFRKVASDKKQTRFCQSVKQTKKF